MNRMYRHREHSLRLRVALNKKPRHFKFHLGDPYKEHPQIYILSFIFSFVGYVGLLFVISMVKSYGALLAVTVTTFRKALSIIMSFFFFTKPFTIQYVWSGMIVFAGIMLNIYR